MRESGRIAAALSVLEDFETRRVPIKIALADWARGARFAGAKDRAFISGLALDVLRRKSALNALGGLRVGVAHTLIHVWNRSAEDVAAAFSEAPHGAGALSSSEMTAAELELPTAGAIGANVPTFCWDMFEKSGLDPSAEGLASAQRAPFDLRINTLKADRERTEKALEGYSSLPTPYVRDGLRFAAERADHKSPNLQVTPAFLKGWIEVQDEGSQIAALAAGPLAGAQVLDLCAGGGGKTLALAALMGNTGQIYAYDADAARLAPTFERLNRAGVRNAQLISPAERPDRLPSIRGRMDLVFVDAPCSGSGTWRRKPDTKWRFTPSQLALRMEDQGAVLANAAEYVMPGGVIVYVTCSYFAEENEDRVTAFLGDHPDFIVDDPLAAIVATGRLNEGARDILRGNLNRHGTLRVTPATTGTDAFGITRLVRRSR